MHNATNQTDSFSKLLKSFMTSKGISPESIGYAFREPVALVERWVEGSILPSEKVLYGIVHKILELSPRDEVMLVDAYARTKVEGRDCDLKLLWINAAPERPSIAFSLLFDHLYVEFDARDNTLYWLQFDVAAKGVDVVSDPFVDSVLTYVAINRGVLDRMETARVEVVDFTHTNKNLVSRLVMNAQPLLQRVFGLGSSNNVPPMRVKAQLSKQPIDPDRAFSLVDSVGLDGDIQGFRSREYRQREYVGTISFNNKPSCYIGIEVLRSDIDSVHHVWVTVDCMHELSEQEKSDIEQVVRSTLHGFVWRWGTISGSLPITIVYSSSSRDDDEFKSRKCAYESKAFVASWEGYTPYQHPIDWLDDEKTCGLFKEMYLEVEREPMVIVEDGVRHEMRLHVMVDTTIEDAETLARLVDGLSKMLTLKVGIRQYAVIRFFIKMPLRSDEKVIRFVNMINANATKSLRLLMIPDDDLVLREVLSRGQEARNCAHVSSDNVSQLRQSEVALVDDSIDTSTKSDVPGSLLPLSSLPIEYGVKVLKKARKQLRAEKRAVSNKLIEIENAIALIESKAV